MKVGGGFDVQAFHGAVIIRARARFGFHGKWYTILRGEKGSGARFVEILVREKKGRQT